MQSTTESFWTISETSFNEQNLGELIFGENINQTFIIERYVAEDRDDRGFIAGARIVGMVEYPSGQKIDGIPQEIELVLNQTRRSRNAPIAPSRELTPGWVRPYNPQPENRVQFYAEDFSSTLSLSFISRTSEYCQFGFHINILGLVNSVSWKPAGVSTFAQGIFRRELEMMLVEKRVAFHKDQITAIRSGLAGLETLGCVAAIKTKSGEKIKLSEAEIVFEIFDPLQHLGAILPEENLTPREKRRMTSLANLINDAFPDEVADMRAVVDNEVRNWKENWKEAMKWMGENTPVHSSVDKGDIDTVNHPIIDSFIDAGFFEAYELDNRIFVKPTTAGFLVLSAIVKNN